jgi:hypothetical protein
MNFETFQSFRQSAYFKPASAPKPAASKIMLYLKNRKNQITSTPKCEINSTVTQTLMQQQSSVKLILITDVFCKVSDKLFYIKETVSCGHLLEINQISQRPLRMVCTGTFLQFFTIWHV